MRRYGLQKAYYGYLLTIGHTRKEADKLAREWAEKNPQWAQTHVFKRLEEIEEIEEDEEA